jgi:cell division septation protein DedD
MAAAPTAEPARRASGPVAAERSVLFAVHIASYRTEESAEAGWRIIRAEAPQALAGLHPRLEHVDLGPEQGVYLRLKAGPLDSRADAAARCAALVDTGHYCKTADFEGRELPG